VGQKFPLAMSRIQGRALDVIFPAASQAGQSEDSGAIRQLIEVGTRWMVVLMLPLYLVLGIAAPYLLRVWIGDAHPDQVAVMQLTCGAMVVAALGGGCEQVLWGQGEARKVFLVNLATLAAIIGISLCFIKQFGIQGIAWGFFLSMALRSIGYLYLASRTEQIGLFNLLVGSLKGILLPATACGAVTLGILSIARPGRWLDLIAASFAGCLAYGIVLYFVGARQEERMLVREVLSLPISLTRSGWRGLKRQLRRIGPLHSAHIFWVSLYSILTYDPEKVTARIEHDFTEAEDPYHLSEQEDQERLRRELAMLDSARGEAKFGHALEIGCAEGTFTELLAPSCEELVALDNSPTALARARERCRRFESVQFDQWDMRRDPLPGKFNLIVVIGTLGHLYLPREFRKARAQIIDALLPGGYLLVGEARREVYENFRWAKMFLLGGKQILDFISGYPGLKVVARSNVGPWVHALFQKVSPNESN
jgi:SAM-dependent methyltransferase